MWWRRLLERAATQGITFMFPETLSWERGQRMPMSNIKYIIQIPVSLLSLGTFCRELILANALF